MKKVLVVYHFIPHYRMPVFRNLAEANELDIHFSFFAEKAPLGDIKNASNDFFESIDFIEANNVWLLGKFLCQFSLLKLLFKERYDAVIFLADPHFVTTWLAACFLKLKRTKVLFWTHGFIRGNELNDKLKLLFYKLADGMLLYGNIAKENLVNRNVAEEKIFTIYNSLDYDSQSQIKHQIQDSKTFLAKKKSLFANHSNFQMIFVGRLTPQKKLDMLVDVLHRLKMKNTFVNLLFVGQGEMTASLQSKVTELGLDEQVNFYGQTYDEFELANLIMSSDVCVSPGEIGLTAMHVLAYGVPVITHNNYNAQMPEFEAVVEGKTGYLYEFGNIESLDDCITKLMKQPIPNQHLNCIEIIEEHYTPKAQKKFILEALSELEI